MQVSELFARLENAFKNTSWAKNALVVGEIAEVKTSDKHLYFYLADCSESNNPGRISCRFFNYFLNRKRSIPSAGSLFVVSGSLSTYKVRGDLFLKVSHLEPAGQGVIQERLERLKRKLQAEHLFDDDRKLPLPEYPKVIGLVTSENGMARGDIEKIFRERNPHVRLWLAPALVQGAGAPLSLIRALKLLESLPEVDAIILGRGGGSAEDLMAFNDESLVRAVAACTKPVVTAIGHDGDRSLCDLAASVIASTPTNAAAVVVPHCCADILHAITEQYTQATNAFSQRLRLHRQELQSLSQQCHLLSPLGRIETNRQSLAHSCQSLRRIGPSLTDKAHNTLNILRCSPAWNNLQQSVEAHSDNLRRCKERLESELIEYSQDLHITLDHLKQTLLALNPQRPLNKGYALVRDGNGQVVSSVAQVQPGDSLIVALSDGQLRISVQEIVAASPGIDNNNFNE